MLHRDNDRTYSTEPRGLSSSISNLIASDQVLMVVNGQTIVLAGQAHEDSPGLPGVPRAS